MRDRWLRVGEDWWTASSALGAGVSLFLLALAVRDDRSRRMRRLDGALAIMTRSSIVLKSQLLAYFALSLTAAWRRDRDQRIALLVLGNLVLTSAALYRLLVRRRMIRWSSRRGRRASDRPRRDGALDTEAAGA